MAVDNIARGMAAKALENQGGGGSSLPIVNTAAIGQTIRVSAVDDAGKPTEWEAVEFPAGGGAEPKRLYYGTAENVTAFTDSVDFENYRNFVVVVGGTKGETAISIPKGDLSIGEMVVNVGYYTKFLDATTTSYPDGCVIHNLTEIGEKEGYPVFRIEYAEHNINIKPEMDVWKGPASTSWDAKTGMIVARKDKGVPKNSVALKFSAEVSYLEVTIYGY